MPFYNYACLDCERKAKRKLKRDLTSDEYEELVLFETAHAMEPTPEELAEATICPRCQGTNCSKSMYGCNVISYVRGNGYLDRAGALRDMHTFHLTQDDPYGEHRQPGEVDEIKAQLKRAGQHNPRRKHFTPPAEMRKAVEKAVATPDPPAS